MKQSIDPKIAALTAINEALTALDYDCEPSILASDEPVNDALGLLMEARSRLTNKPWPVRPSPLLDPEKYAAWHAARAAEQKADGRQ